MKKIKKIVALFFTFALTFFVLEPAITKASSPSIPTYVLDFDLEGVSIYEEPYMGGHYSNVAFCPNGSTITIKFNAECQLPLNTILSMDLIDGVTGKTVGTKTIYATNNQYATYSGLNSSHYYYLKFPGGSDVRGHFYLSKNGIFA